MKKYSYTKTYLVILLLTISLVALITFLVNSLVKMYIDISSLVVVLLVTMLSVISFLSIYKDVLEHNGDKFLKRKADESEVSVVYKQTKDSIILEYRLAVLEGIVDWMLTNGQFAKEIEYPEMENIHNKAVELVHRNYPEAKIKFEGRWER